MYSVKYFILLGVCWLSIQTFGQKSIETKIIELSKQKNQWMIDRDSQSLKGVFDRELLYIHSSSKVDDYTTMMKSLESKDTKLFRQDLSEAKVRNLKDVAVLTGKLALGVDTKGQISEFNLILTEVWLKKNKRWVLWSRHATRIPAQ